MNKSVLKVTRICSHRYSNGTFEMMITTASLNDVLKTVQSNKFILVFHRMTNTLRCYLLASLLSHRNQQNNYPESLGEGRSALHYMYEHT